MLWLDSLDNWFLLQYQEIWKLESVNRNLDTHKLTMTTFYCTTKLRHRALLLINFFHRICTSTFDIYLNGVCNVCTKAIRCKPKIKSCPLNLFSVIRRRLHEMGGHSPHGLIVTRQFGKEAGVCVRATDSRCGTQLSRKRRSGCACHCEH